jgi:hypothetical protein
MRNGNCYIKKLGSKFEVVWATFPGKDEKEVYVHLLIKTYLKHQNHEWSNAMKPQIM